MAANGQAVCDTDMQTTCDRSTQPSGAPPGTWFGRREDFDYEIFISYRRGDGLKVTEWRAAASENSSATRLRSSAERAALDRDLERERSPPRSGRAYPSRTAPLRFIVVVLTKSVGQTARTEPQTG